MNNKNNRQNKPACKFCKPISQPVLDKNGKPTKEKTMQHDVTVPHPIIFGFDQAEKYFK